jgi:hypothetical protein
MAKRAALWCYVPKKRSLELIINFLIGAIIAAVVGFAFYSVRKKRIMDAAGRVLVEVNAVWAVQGPFKNGEESARAMKLATIAVRGAESINMKPIAEALAKHAASYDSQIQIWESLRQDYLPHAHGQKFEENLAKAVKLGAVKNRKRNLASSHGKTIKKTKRNQGLT